MFKRNISIYANHHPLYVGKHQPPESGFCSSGETGLDRIFGLAAGPSSSGDTDPLWLLSSKALYPAGGRSTAAPKLLIVALKAPMEGSR